MSTADPPDKKPSFLSFILLPPPQPSLTDLKLVHILNGETCPPIAFDDLASFIAKKEFTSENLLFVIWFRSYQSRWDRLSGDTRTKVPIPSIKLGDRYRPFAHVDDESSRHNVQAEFSITGGDASTTPTLSHQGSSNTAFSTGHTKPDGGPSGSLDKEPQSTQIVPVVSSTYPPRSIDIPTTDKVEDQPMREEAVRAFATFLKKGGSRELGISDDLREYAKVCLKRSTAPEVFLPIYEEVYITLETQSLPHFLSYAKANVNRPKQMFWYIVGAIDIFIGIIIFVILTLLLTPRHFSYRAIRLPSTIFTWFGTAQMYSAYRGFCNQVWGRKSSQLKPWELDEGDEEQLVDTPLPTPPIMSTGDLVTYQGPDIGQEESKELSFGPEVKSLDFSFPGDSYPLSDLSGTAQNDAPPWAAQIHVVDDEEEDFTDEKRRRLAVRRDTIKVPDASLAFPIFDQGPSPPPMSPHRRTPSLDISPFDIRTSPNNQPKPSVEVPTARPSAGGGGSTVELGTLLHTFERNTVRADICSIKPKMFGPERVVQDERVKALYESIVRDITVVATIFGIIWVGICFAVPTYGLA